MLLHIFRLEAKASLERPAKNGNIDIRGFQSLSADSVVLIERALAVF
jgi:hypothetical protein